MLTSSRISVTWNFVIFLISLLSRLVNAMSALNKMAAEVSASRMPPPATSNPKTDSKMERDVIKESDAVAVSDELSESMTPSSPECNRGSLNKFRSFTTIPVFFGSRNVEEKPDPSSANDVDVPTEAPKLLADREILSKYQLPIPPWPTYSSYAMVVDKQSTIPTSTKLDE